MPDGLDDDDNGDDDDDDDDDETRKKTKTINKTATINPFFRLNR